MKTVTHKKTGNVYIVMEESVKNCTNANDGQIMVYYRSLDGLHFARDRDEFWTKFTQADPKNIQFKT